MRLSGDKSEVLDIDNPDLLRYPEFVKATRYECELEPGDILFIPGKDEFTLNENHCRQSVWMAHWFDGQGDPSNEKQTMTFFVHKPKCHKSSKST